MAIAYDSSAAAFDNSGSYTFNHTCSGTNRVLFVCTDGSQVTAVTYNGTAMTNSTNFVGNNGNKIWYLASPSTGTNLVSVTASSGSSAVSVSYTGADITTIPDASNVQQSAGSVTSITSSITTITDNSWVLGFVSYSTASVSQTAGSGATQRAVNSGTPFHNSRGAYDSNGPKTPTGSYSMTVNASASSGTMDMMMYSLKPYLTFGFTGPSSGNVNAASTNFTVTPDIAVTGTVTITPSGVGSTGLSPTVLTFSGSAVAQTFTITPLTAGAITLTMTNGCGLNNASPLTYTAIAVVPGAPTIGTAIPGNTNASVSFTAPLSNGGAPITLYTATSTPGTFTGTGATSPVTVSGLTNGVAYTFKVKATNSAGTGAESAASNSATPYIPATSFTFTGPSSGNVRSASTNFTVTPNAVYYGTITLTPTGTGSAGLNPVTLTWSGTSTAQTFTITPLTSGLITLTPTNSNGLSNPANLSYTANAVVPLAPSIGIATPSQGSAFINVGIPTNDGGSTILYYTVTSSPGGITAVSPSTGQVTVNGLTNGTSYTFTATATNAIGTSSASAVSNAVIPSAASVAFANNGPKFTINRTVGNLIQF